MTTNHHTPIAVGAAANAATFNGPLSQLDSVLTGVRSEVVSARSGYPNLDARLDALVLSGGNISTRAIGLQAAGTTGLVVESTSGFIAGARIAYTLTSGAIEYNQITSIPDGTHLNVSATGGQIADNTVISMISESEFQAAQAIPHAGSLTLPDAIEFAAGRTINVLAYGARGDGVTDDTLAFRAAVQALDGGPGRIWVPYGTYLLKKQGAGDYDAGKWHHIIGISNQNNITIEGRGTLKTDGPGAVIVIDNCVNCRVSGLTFYGTRESVGFGHGTAAILAYGNDNLDISGCHFTQWANVAIVDASGEFDDNEPNDFDIRGQQHETRIHHNVFSDCGGGIITKPYGVTNSIYTDNIFLRMGEYGIKIDGEFTYEYPLAPAGRIVVANNLFDSVALFTNNPALVEGAGIRIEENAYDVVISSNVFRNLRIPAGGSTLSAVRGVHITTGQTGRGAGRISVTGNVFDDVEWDAVAVFGGSYTPDPSPLPVLEHCIIANNLIYNCGGGIRLQAATDTAIRFFDLAGNHIYFDGSKPQSTANTFGINLFQVTDCTVRGNTIDGGSGGDVGIAIYVNGACKRVVVEGNLVTNPTTACIRLLNAAAGAAPKEDIVISNNTGRITINSAAPLLYATVDSGVSGVNRLIVEANKYTNSVTTPSAVINVNGWQEVDVRGNTLRNCSIAINLNTVTTAKVTNNIVHETSRNDDAVVLTNCTNVIRRHNITNGKIFDEVYTINDDAAISLTPPADMGLVTVLGQYNLSFSGTAMYAITGSGATTLPAGVGSNFNVTTGVLAGTTGADGKTTVSAHTDGRIYIENRSGTSRTFYIRYI